MSGGEGLQQVRIGKIQARAGTGRWERKGIVKKTEQN